MAVLYMHILFSKAYTCSTSISDLTELGDGIGQGDPNAIKFETLVSYLISSLETITIHVFVSNLIICYIFNGQILHI